MTRHPLVGETLDRRVPAMSVHQHDAAKALLHETVEQVANDGDQRLDPQRNGSRKCAEAGRDAVAHRREHRDAERLGGFDRDTLGEDAVGGEAEVSVLLGAAERNHGAIVPRQIALDLHPVGARDPHARASLERAASPLV